MGFGLGGNSSASAYGAPYFDGSFILFLVLILLVFGSTPYPYVDPPKK